MLRGGRTNYPATGANVTKKLVRDVNPTHSKSGLPLKASATTGNQWSDNKVFGQSIRSLPSQILRKY